MAVKLYTRVSTTEQANGSSLSDQERRCRGAAMMLGDETPEVFSDPGISGSMPLAQRPDGSRLVASLTRGDYVIASKLDRLFRSASDALNTAEALQKDGISLILLDCGADPVTGTGAAKLFFGILASVAEFEKGRILERMVDGRRGKRAKGGHIGGKTPYGFRVVGTGKDATLEPVEREQAIIEAAKAFRVDGASYRDVSTSLALRGMMSRAGRAFTAEQVRRMLGG